MSGKNSKSIHRRIGRLIQIGKYFEELERLIQDGDPDAGRKARKHSGIGSKASLSRRLSEFGFRYPEDCTEHCYTVSSELEAVEVIREALATINEEDAAE